MTTALATPSDVEAALGRTLTAEEETRANALLLLASAAVEDATGYRFTPGDYTVSRTVRRCRVVLPAKVESVEEVREVDQWDGSAELVDESAWTLRGNTVWTSARFVEVDFTVSAEVPNEIVTLVGAIVANTMAMPAAGVASETTGPYAVSYVSTSGRVFLTVSDKAVLRRYKQPKPAIEALA